MLHMSGLPLTTLAANDRGLLTGVFIIGREVPCDVKLLFKLVFEILWLVIDFTLLVWITFGNTY